MPYLLDLTDENIYSDSIRKKILFWHRFISPILVKSNVFYDWLSYCIPRILQYKDGKTPYNLSDITFGMSVKGNAINLGRFGIGTFDLSPESFRRFRNLLLNFGGRNAYLWFQQAQKRGDVVGLAFAIDIPEKLKKFYVYYHQENPRIDSVAVDWDTGLIVEHRLYRALNPNGDVEMIGNQKGRRIQRNFPESLKTPAEQIKFIRKLPMSRKAKRIAERIIRSGYNLDTYAFGNHGRVALYFE